MKTLHITSKIVSISIILIGIIHCLATPMIMKGIPKDIYNVFLFLFLITGYAYIFFGIVLFVVISRFNKQIIGSLKMHNLTLVFIVSSSAFSVYLLPENIFTWISLCISGFGSLIRVCL